MKQKTTEMVEIEYPRIMFYSCTNKSSRKDTLLYQSLKEIGFFEFHIETNFTGSLTKQYNKFLKEEDSSNTDLYDVIIFCHDDIKINTMDFRKLTNNPYTVFGLAGTNTCTFKKPFLWHLVSDRQTQLGAVAHFADDKHDDYWITSFGLLNKQAVLIDGVFIGVNLKKWSKNKVWFDEKIPSNYHFYDLAFSLDNNFAKNKVGVIDFPIIHCSHGLNSIEDPEWNKGQNYMFEKYNKYEGNTLTI
jgi:hypothetical protein